MWRRRCRQPHSRRAGRVTSCDVSLCQACVPFSISRVGGHHVEEVVHLVRVKNANLRVARAAEHGKERLVGLLDLAAASAAASAASAAARAPPALCAAVRASGCRAARPKALRTRLWARGAQPLVALHHAVAHEHGSELRVVPRVPAPRRCAHVSRRRELVQAPGARRAHFWQSMHTVCKQHGQLKMASDSRPLRCLVAHFSSCAAAVRSRRPMPSARALLRAHANAAPYRLAPRHTARRRRLRLLLHLRERAAVTRHAHGRGGTPTCLLQAQPPPPPPLPPLRPRQSKTTSFARPRCAAAPPGARKRRLAPPPQPPSRSPRPQPPRTPAARADTDVWPADMRRERASLRRGCKKAGLA